MESQRSDHSTMQAKAAAAAKLVLQDLDPSAKKKRQLFTSGPPQGILTLHLKTIKNFGKTYFVTSSFASGSDTHHLYLKTAVQDFVKCSKIVEAPRDSSVIKQNRKSSALWSRNSTVSQDLLRERSNNIGENSAVAASEIRLNEVKVFSLDLSSNKEDLSNKMHFELTEVCGRTKTRRSIGVGTLHLFDLIKEMYGYKTLSLTVKDKQIADVQFEYIFRYGIFGYGYSHELEQNDILVKNVMKESMFFKLHPLPNRADDDGLLIPARIKALSLVKASDEEKVETASSTKTSCIEQLIRNRGRLHKLKQEYLSLQTSHDRTTYLRNVLYQSASPDSHQDGLDTDDDAEQTSSQPTDALHRDDETKDTVGKLTPLLLMAPGLKPRNDARASTKTAPGDYRDEESTLIVRLREMYKETLNDKASSNDPRESTNNDDSQGRSSRLPISPKSDQKKGFLNILRKKVLTPIRLGKMLNENRTISPLTAEDSDIIGQTLPTKRDGEISSEYKPYATTPCNNPSADDQLQENSHIFGSATTEVRNISDSTDVCAVKHQDECE